MAPTTDKRTCRTCDRPIVPFRDRVHNIDAWGHSDIAPNEAPPDHIALPAGPLMMVTRTVQFTLDRTFTSREQDTAKAAAEFRNTSQHHILAERVRAEAAKALWAAGFQVDYDFPERGDHIGFAHAPPANGQNLCSHCTS